ncbi:MAG: hypothetical protein U9Q06_00345 [Nanoarchaeota archaeon]|nr:hypothetical protein [Nanoarchaeota archaeon]
MANYTYYHEGGTSALDSNYGTIGYRLPSGQIGTSLRPDTAAQIVEVNNILNQGFKQVEVGSFNTEVLDQIPKKHFKEINRLSKLTGSKASFHAPIQDIEASGIQEAHFSELNRELTERKLKNALDRAHDLSPDEPIPVTMHSANMGGTEFTRGEGGEFKESQIVAINQETGDVKNIFKEEERAYPSDIARYGEPVKKSPQEQLDTANHSQWINSINQLFEYKKSADEVIGNSLGKITQAVDLESQGINLAKDGTNNPQIRVEADRLQNAGVFLDNVQTAFGSQFEKAYKYSEDKETKEQLKKLADDWAKAQSKIQTDALEQGYGRVVEIEGHQFVRPKLGKEVTFLAAEVAGKKEIMDSSLNALNQIGSESSPQVYKKVEDFAIDHSAKTFANVAFHSYDKYGKNAPIVSIENMYTGMAYANPTKFKELISLSRNELTKQLKQEKNLSETEARKVAEQVIGVTWDVGHLNMLKKRGFTDKDMIKATKLIGKEVKHIHLSDNFGYNDSHLPQGMGNVPTKEHLKELEKAGALTKDTMVINEISGFVNQFKQSPMPYMLEAFGSQVGDSGVYWNQAVGGQGNYFATPLAYLPDQHFTSIYGGGFSNLPTELGGMAQGNQSRFSGTPNA